jgi:phage terminase large subunit GpA-like protein
MIVLEWQIKEDETKTGLKAGIMFEMTASEHLDPASVYYKTQCCGKALYDYDKTIFLPAGKWVPTATPIHEAIRSYHVNSLYSAAGMFSWTDMTYEWLKAWDVQKNRIRDINKYKEFRNTKQGLPFEDRGESPRYERVIAHRRNYARNQIKNKAAEKETGSLILLLTCACDVQIDKIYCDIKGWCRNGVSYTIDFRVLEGETKQYNKGAWIELIKIIENEVWTADDGKQYRIRSTFIDAGYRAEAVYSFCGQYSSGVYPTFGRDWISDGLTLKLAAKETITNAGTLVFHINTSKIKDKIAASFKTDWNIGDKQPDWRPNFPEDLRDDFFKMYEAEYKAEKKDLRTNKVLGIFWVQQSGAPNHSFDTHCYNIACLEMIAENVCLNELGLLSLQWPEFWDYCMGGTYYTMPKEKK